MSAPLSGTTAPMTPPTGDLLYSDVEDDLRASVRAVLEKGASWNDVLARTESPEPTDPALWTVLATDVGCAALAVPEELGGAGASWREAAVVAEELGRAVAPVPFLGSTIATAVLLAGEDPELLRRVASGEVFAALAVPFSAAPGDRSIAVRLVDGALHGEIRSVADARSADVLLVPTVEGVYTVDAADVQRADVVSLDMTRPLVDLVFDGAPARLLVSGAAAPAVLDSALRIGAVLLAGEQLGAAERCLEMAVEYLKLRRQFGRVLGSYQALKHRLADLWVLVGQARAVARYAAVAAASGSSDLPVAAALAQAHCSVVAQQAAEECLQLHGGIGFTWEHPAHLYLKRAKSATIALGTPDRHRATLAGLVDLPAPLAAGGEA